MMNSQLLEKDYTAKNNEIKGDVMKLTKNKARKVLEVIDAGLCRGLGKPKPGFMCVEAAVCYGLGLPFGDDPACVHPAIRAFKIALNDSVIWKSNASRAAGLRRIGIAQLGSTEIDGQAWSSYVAEQHIRRVVPIPFKIVAKLIPSHKDSLLAVAKRCETEGTANAANAANAAARAAANAAYAAANAAYAASDAANAAARAAARAANAAAYATANAAYAASDAANAAARAAAYVARAAARTHTEHVLHLSAEIAVEACIKFGTQGSKWLDICD